MTELDVERLPDDIEVLHDIIKTIYKEGKELTAGIEKVNRENAWLREVIAARNRRLFGRKSEKLSHEELQAWLFNEAELGTGSGKPEKKNEKIVVRAYTRSKKGRKPIAANIPRRLVEHDVSEKEKTCGFCGQKRPRLAPETTEEIEYVPAQVYVNRHVYHKYGPCGCAASKGTKPVISAGYPKRILPGSMASPSLLSFLATSKFCDGLPFYRLEKMLLRQGIEYSRTVMCNQMIGLSCSLQPLLELMWEELLTSPVIGMDETRLQVLAEPGREADQESWIHVALGEREGRKIILFHYHTSRRSEIPAKILEGWQGYLQTDGLAAYHEAGEQPGIKQVGCWAHARRKFMDGRGGPKAPPGGLADEALDMIGELFKTEEKLRGRKLSDEEFVKKRREAVWPVLEKLKAWLMEKCPRVVPQSLLADAIKYTLNQWDKLVRYLERADIRPDNNAVENVIRYFVIGRKNWLFAVTPLGAHASAALYSLIQSARANNLNEYAYMKYILTVFPMTEPEKMRDLLPHRIDPKLFRDD